MNKKEQTYVVLIFMTCLFWRIIEYFFIQTDKTWLSENFIHKVIGIIIMYVTIRKLHFTWSDICFGKKKVLLMLLIGGLIGLSIFGIAYCYEYFSLQAANPQFEFFVSAYSLNGNVGHNTNLYMIVLCIILNIINVVMEEGIFRGVFMKLLGSEKNFWMVNIMASFLFGLWHIVMPLFSVLSGGQSIVGGVMMAAFYILTTFLIGVALGCWQKITGSLWFGMAYHFINNTIVNILHIVTTNGIDEMLSNRLAITQTMF